MKAGQIVEVGAPKQLYLKPEKIFTAKFLGEADFITGDVEEAMDTDIVVDVNGSKLRARNRAEDPLKVGEKCVLAIRPEFALLTKKPDGLNTWKCEVAGASFVGDTIRYDVHAENGTTLLVKSPATSFEAGYESGDEAYVTFPEENLLTYRLPEEGLEKALSLE